MDTHNIGGLADLLSDSRARIDGCSIDCDIVHSKFSCKMKMPGELFSSGGGRIKGRRQGGNFKVSINTLPSLPRLPCSCVSFGDSKPMLCRLSRL